MMPSPNLDDQNVKDIFDAALAHMSRLCGQDLDVSYQDPGVALLELFALLKDMQHFYANHVDDAHRRKYAALLGCTPSAAQSACVPLVFSSADTRCIPKGYVVKAGDVSFATLSDLPLSANNLCAVLTCQDGCFTPVPDGAPFRPFGQAASQSNALYLGFAKNPALFPLHCLYVHSENLPTLSVPLGRLCAEAFDGSAWTALALEDDTGCLRRSGYLRFEAFPPMKPGHISPEHPSLFWMRISLGENHFALAPVIKGIWLNAVPAVQTPCRGMEGNVRKGMANVAADPAVTVHNPCDAEGGADEESVPQLMERAGQDYRKPYRAVTAGDYARILREQAPLPIDAVCAAYQDGGVTLYVKPASDDPLPVLSPAYRQNLLAFLEPYRLLTTRLRIQSPVYCGVTVHAALCISGDVSHPAERILRQIRTLLPEAGSLVRFTAGLSYGELYGSIAALPFVRRLVSLTMEYNGKRTASGILQLPDGGMAYAKDIQITQVREVL